MVDSLQSKHQTSQHGRRVYYLGSHKSSQQSEWRQNNKARDAPGRGVPPPPRCRRPLLSPSRPWVQPQYAALPLQAGPGVQWLHPCGQQKRQLDVRRDKNRQIIKTNTYYALTGGVDRRGGGGGGWGGDGGGRGRHGCQFLRERSKVQHTPCVFRHC